MNSNSLRHDPDEPLSLQVTAVGATRIRIHVSTPAKVLLDHVTDAETVSAELWPGRSQGSLRVAVDLRADPVTELKVICRLGQGTAQVSWSSTPRTNAIGLASLSTNFELRPSGSAPSPAETWEWSGPRDVAAAPAGSAAARVVRMGRKRAAGAEYVVWYGTNRRPVSEADSARGYSHDRDDRLHYGRCRVLVPESHRIGSTGSPWWRRVITGTDDRLRIEAVEPLQAEAHWADLRRVLGALERGLDHAVIFIHGYNVSFTEAALRAAQIGFDLQVRAMAFFSWPSRGTVKGYMADEENIQASEPFLAAYLTAFAEQSGASHVHVIAHSMGNRGLLRAVNRSLAAAEGRTGVCFGEFILAAPDVDADVFRDLSRAYQGVCRRATLYVSARDRAVAASRALHGAARVGYTPPVTVLPHVDTVSVENIDLTMLGHGYIAEARDVLHDMHDLIFHANPPERRMGLRAEQAEEGRYWVIRA